MKNLLKLLACMALLAPAINTYADYDRSRDKPGTPPPSNRREASTTNFGCSPLYNSRAELNINNVRALILISGDMWWDRNIARYEVPKVTDVTQVRRTSLFAGAIWIAGRDSLSKELLVTAQTYSSAAQRRSYWPGPIDELTTATSKGRCDAWDQHFQCLKTTVLQYLTDYNNGLITGPNQIPDEIKYWPGRLNPFLPTKADRPIQSGDLDFSLARFNDVDRDGIYNPLLGDYPQLPGDDGTSQRDVINSADQTFFFVMNDMGFTKLFDGQPSGGIGMEVQTEAFAYVTSDPRNDMTFYRNKLINKGNRIIKDCYFGQWVDPDLGYSADDYVGCDVARGLGICYNGTDNDPTLLGYGANPPTVAVDFFIGPEADPGDGIDNNKNGSIDELGEKIIMSNFLYYVIGGDPVNGDPDAPNDYYNYLRNIWKNGQRVSYDLKIGRTTVGQGTVPGSNIPIPPAVFIFPDASDREICWGNGGTVARPCPTGSLPSWNERVAGNPPGDRRFLSSAGPFTLMPGAVNQLTIGVVWARASSGGATGSVNKLLLADDMAQRLFDRNFKILLGPQEPKVRITELDRELIFTIIPDTFQGVGTEDYSIVDNSLNPIDGPQEYKFEGYKIYQLADDKVSTGELDDPNRAVLIAQSDIRNGVGRIINREFDPVTSEVIPRVKVEGADKGLQNVIRVTNDAFTQNAIINHQRYYFRVITYAYNANTKNIEPFLQGFPIPSRGTGTFFGVPHKTESTFNGLVLNSKFGQRFDLTRITGSGTGGRRMTSLTGDDENNAFNATLTSPAVPLKIGGVGAPIEIKVYDPTLVRQAELKIELSSRLVFRPNGSETFRVGDTIVSNLFNEPFKIGAANTALGTNDIVSPSERSLTVTHLPAEAVINRILPYPNSDSVALDISVLNDDQGGRFSWLADIYYVNPDDRAKFDFADYKTFYRSFRKKSTPFVPVPAGNAPVHNVPKSIYNYDYWKLTDLAKPNAPIYNKKPVSQSPEQLITAYGISLSVVNVENPLYRIRVNRGNGFVAGDVSYNDVAKPWLSGIASRGATSWTVADVDDFSAIAEQLDPASQYLEMLNRTWVPGSLARPTSTQYPSPVYTVPATDQKKNIRNLRNIDVVFTSDKSKWTRVPVVQTINDTVTALDGRPYISTRRQMMKSRTASVDQNFVPTGGNSPYVNGATTYPTRGMSWFPGYAIDLDRGIRLNMMFSENHRIAGVRGNDLRYEFPIVDGQGNLANQNWVYVMDQPYDAGVTMETRFDSIDYALGRNRNRGTELSFAIANRIYGDVMYIGYPGVRLATIPKQLQDPIGIPATETILNDRRYPFNNTAKVSIRVNRSFANYKGGPTYLFNSTGLEAVEVVRTQASSALGQIRVTPNPYYAYSSYEVSQTDNRVKIINLPNRCDISIFTINGTLIRTFSVDLQSVKGTNVVNSIDWNLTNQQGLPIGSGSYLIHIDAKELGSKTIKWFGVTRPLDVEGINQN